MAYVIEGIQMKEYMQMFIWIMLFVIVVEMIFPDSEYKKYIKLVLGCIIIYMLIKPIAQFVPQQGQTYKSYVENYQGKLAEGIAYSATQKDYTDQVEHQQTLLKDTFSQSLRAVIEREAEIKVLSIYIEYGKGEEGQGIEKIDLIVGDKTEEQERKVNIPQIRIGEKNKNVSGDEEKLKIKIKTCLKNFYNVPSSNIHITVQKN